MTSTPSPRKLPQSSRNILRKADAQDIQEHSALSDPETDSTLNEPQPLDIDDAWLYTFQAGEAVWIKTAGGLWHLGRITGQTRIGRTRHKEGLFYPVTFQARTLIRKHFAPLNGEIKPDTPHIRQLLKEAGFI